MTEELPPALPGEDHKPFTGQGPATWVLTLAVLVPAGAAWFLVPRLVKLLRQRKPARAISLVPAVILMVCAAGAGVATAALFGIGGRPARRTVPRP